MSEKGSEKQEIVLDFYKDDDGEEQGSAVSFGERPLSKVGSKSSGLAAAIQAHEGRSIRTKSKNNKFAASDNLLNQDDVMGQNKLSATSAHGLSNFSAHSKKTGREISVGGQLSDRRHDGDHGNNDFDNTSMESTNILQILRDYQRHVGTLMAKYKVINVYDRQLKFNPSGEAIFSLSRAATANSINLFSPGE